MAYRTGRTHFVNFRVYNTSGTAVAGLLLSNFSVLFFVDNVVCTVPLILTQIATGLYSCTYVPEIAGFYYLELYNSTYNARISDGVEIDTLATFFGLSSNIALTQNYGSTNKFQVTLPNPQSYTLYIYNSSDWTVGNTSMPYVVNSTAIDTNGNWVTPTLNVVSGTYNIVITNSTSTKVLAAFLVV